MSAGVSPALEPSARGDVLQDGALWRLSDVLESRSWVGSLLGISHNEFDYVTFRRKEECVRSAVRCATSKSSKTARIRTSEARAQGPSTEGAVRRGAEHIILSYAPVLASEVRLNSRQGGRLPILHDF